MRGNWRGKRGGVIKNERKIGRKGEKNWKRKRNIVNEGDFS